MEEDNRRNKMSDQLDYLKKHAPELFGKVRLEQFFNENFRKQLEAVKKEDLLDALNGYYELKAKGEIFDLEHSRTFYRAKNYLIELFFDEE